MWENTTPAGKRFAHDCECLYQRWRRLVNGIIAYWGGSPVGAIEDTERDLENLELHHRSDWYPNPRPLTSEEQACLDWRIAIASSSPVPSVGFYDFEFPNATEWLLILDGDGFSMNIPSRIEVFDRSFSHRSGGATFPTAGLAIDGNIISGATRGTVYGHINAAILSPDQEHAINRIGTGGFLAISLLYTP